MTSDELLERISSAFGDALRPGAMSRSVAIAVDNEWEVSESCRKELQEQDDGHHWWELTDKDIENFPGVFAYLDAEAFRFYLPAFMAYGLRRYRTSNSSAIDDTLSACAYPRERFALFDGAQMQCVLDFLIFFAANENRFTARRAVEALDFLTGPSRDA